MTHARLWTAGGILAAIIIILFVLSVPHTHEIANTPTVTEATTSVPSVSITDAFRRGLHVITGSLTAPDACTTASATTTLLGNASTTESLLVAVSLPHDTSVCLQLPTKTDFKTSIAAPAGLPIAVTVNGITATTTSSP